MRSHGNGPTTMVTESENKNKTTMAERAGEREG